jgi:hypothetical protein
LINVLINERGINKFQSIQCNILDDLANMSDHKALVTTLELNSNLDFSPISIMHENNIDLMKPDLKLRYNSSLNINLDYFDARPWRSYMYFHVGNIT